MTAIATPSVPRLRTAPVLAFGFLYWLAFLLVLQPGNILRAAGSLDPLQETLRIGGAALLGAITTPGLVALVRRWPPVTTGRLTIAALCAITVSTGLIAASCLLAPLVLRGDFPPFWQDFARNLAGNGLLLLCPIAGVLGIAYALTAREPSATAHPDVRIQIRNRGSFTFVAPDDIDWIEAQGNYAALHIAGHVHLLRETMAVLESRLDPAKFVRVSRSALVPLARVRRIVPVSNGDARIELLDGNIVRLSRRYRAAVHARLGAG